MSYLKPDQIGKSLATVEQIERKHDQLVLTFNHYQYKTEQGGEYARHGYMRRLGTLRRCIENVFALIPPEMDVIPEKTVLNDAQINVQAFLANVYGAIDNLAWVWVFERGLDGLIHRSRVGLRAKHKEMRKTFSDSFRSYLQTLDRWMEYLIVSSIGTRWRIEFRFIFLPAG